MHPRGNFDATLRDTLDSSGIAHASSPFRPGDVLARRYTLIAVLGAGGQGEVWEAEDRVVGDRVALKVLSHQLGVNAARARREIATLRVLRLPGVVQLRDEWVEGEHAFLVMDRVDGRPFPGQPPALAWSDIEPVATRLLETLDRIHAAGVVHGDLKPSNVLVDAAGYPTVLDFGLAQSGIDRTMAARYGTRGTPQYFAPEQIAGAPITVQSDLYAVGLMLFEALTGRFPQDGRTRTMLAARRSQPPLELSEFLPDVPAAVHEAIDQMLALRPDDRPRSAAEALLLVRGGNPGFIEVLPELRPKPGCERITEEELRELFAGPDRLFHLREDGARILLKQTDGRPGAVRAEVDAWVRAGLAGWHDGKLVVNRDSLERLEMGFVRGFTPWGSLGTATLPAHLAETLSWIALAGPAANVDLLTRIKGGAKEEAQAEITDLIERGLLRRTADGYLQPLVSPPSHVMTPAQRRTAHALLARWFPQGTPGRLVHLIAGGEDPDTDWASDVFDEAIIYARALAKEGRLSGALVTLEEGLRALRSRPHSVSEISPAFVLWIEIAMIEQTSVAFDRALYEILRIVPTTPFLEHMAALMRTGLALESWDERAWSIIRDVPTFEDPVLERLRQELRMMAARRASMAQEQEVFRYMVDWARSEDDSRATAMALYWEGKHLYRMGQFPRAAEAFFKAAADQPWAELRIKSEIDGAVALLEEAPLRAMALAQRSREEARRKRLPTIEAWSEYVIRSAAYRNGEELEPDDELIESVSHIRNTNIRGLVGFTEAAIAYRAGNKARVLGCLRSCYEMWLAAANPFVGDLVCAMAVACGASRTHLDLKTITERAANYMMPGIGIQSLALIASAGAPITADRETLLRLAHTEPVDRWDWRLDVLSVNESLAMLRAAGVQV